MIETLAVSGYRSLRNLVLPLERLNLITERSQVIVVSHALPLIQALELAENCRHLHLEKSFGETSLAGTTLFNKPKWDWPAR